MTTGQNKTCRGCSYLGGTRDGTNNCCEYMAITGKSRIVLGLTDGVKPGMRCKAYTTAKIAGKQEKKRPQVVRKKETERIKAERAERRAAQIRAQEQERLHRQQEKEHRQSLMLEFYLAGKSDAEIASEVGLAKKTIEVWRHRNKLQSNYKSPVNPEALAHYYALGYSDPQIARTTGCSKSAVQKWRYRTNRPANVPYTRAKSSSLEGTNVLELYRSGMNDQMIANQLGCSPRTICRWRELNELPKNDTRGGSHEHYA